MCEKYHTSREFPGISGKWQFKFSREIAFPVPGETLIVKWGGVVLKMGADITNWCWTDPVCDECNTIDLQLTAEGTIYKRHLLNNK
jgi:hypothetical protein